MTLILPKHRIAFVGACRTGSTTIADWLCRCRYGANRAHGGAKLHTIKDLPDGYFNVISVRDPYTRVPSMWSYLKLKNKTDMCFTEWLDNVYGSGMRPGSRWAPLRTTISEHLRPMLARIDFVIHLETLETDLRRLAAKLGLRWRRLGTPRKVTPEAFKVTGYDDAVKGMIVDKSKEDFRRFGYPIY